MNFWQQVSAYNLGLLNATDLPDVAMSGIEEGLDSESLRILAGKQPGNNPFELSHYYTAALKELGMDEPDRRSAMFNVIGFYAQQIASRQVDPYPGFALIGDLFRKTAFYYDAFDLVSCYAHFISIWEVKTDGLQLHTGEGLTKEQYIAKRSEELSQGMAEWLKKYDE